MESATAEFLAEEVFRQFGEMPLADRAKIKIDREAVYRLLARIPAKTEAESERMRFLLNLPVAERSFYDSQNNARLVLEIAGLITNYDTPYNPSYWVRKGRNILEKAQDKEVRSAIEKLERITNEPDSKESEEPIIMKTNDAILCRKIRDDPEIVRRRHTSYQSGNPYSVFAELSKSRAYTQKHGGCLWWKMPLVFIPNTPAADLREVLETCLKYQLPSRDISESWFNDTILVQ